LGFFTPSVIAKIQELFDLYDAAEEFDAADIIKLMVTSINQSRLAKEVDKTFNERVFIRALKSPEIREEFRKKLKLSSSSEHVSFTECDCDYSAWLQCPSTLENFVRLNEKIIDVDYCHDVIHRLSLLGMDEQASSYSKFLTSSLNKKDKYLGFQKVELSYISSILAKINGFVPNSGVMSLLYDNNVELARFLLNSLCFSNDVLRVLCEDMNKTWHIKNPTNFFDAMECINYNDWESAAKYLFKRGSVYNFRARIYSAAEPLVKNLLSDEILTLIDKLDNFHDNNFSPIFDYFLLLVPTISLTESTFFNNNFGSYSIHNGRILRTFSRREEAIVFLDFLLIEHGMSVPVLLGRKDDHLYFISYCI
jgi:hypothetical protein